MSQKLFHFLWLFHQLRFNLSLQLNLTKLKKEEYELVNKTELSSEYLLTESSIKMMKFLLKDNPKNPHWSQMKLYLKKHAIEKSIARWGSFELMLAEKDRRKKESFSRELS
jgi:hypothetical protein